MFRIKKRVGFFVIAVLSLILFYQRNYEVPILMYHHVGNPADSPGLNVSIKTFEQQMEFLKVHQYNVMSLPYLMKLIKAGEQIPSKTVAVTFDDGNVDNFTNAFPVLKKMNFPATIFMITRNINQEGWLSEEDLKILHESNITIGSHTVNHAFLPNLKRQEVAFELRASKKKLERTLFYPVTLFSYPAGGVSKEARDLVEKEGYEGAVTTNYGRTRHDPYALHRIKITEEGGSLFKFWVKASGLYHFGKRRIDIT